MMSAILAFAVAGVLILLYKNTALNAEFTQKSKKSQKEIEALTSDLAKEKAMAKAEIGGLKSELAEERRTRAERIGTLEREAASERAAAQTELRKLKSDLTRFTPIIEIEREIERQEEMLKARRVDLAGLESLVRDKTAELKQYEIRQDLEEASFYHPRYAFEDIAQYAEALEIVRAAQTMLIRQKRAFHDVGGVEVKGNIRKLGNLALMAFNGESELVIERVAYDNFEQSKEKMRVLFNKVNDLTANSGVILSADYLDLRIKEMAIAFDYQQAEQKAIEEQMELKAQMREEEEARSEAEKSRLEAIEEQERYEAALAKAQKELESKSEGERAEYENKIRALQEKLDEATAERQRATAMAQITKKGHVYIISNIGSFGESVFKIGMTRREDPHDRIKELGDASVPFGFDIHAMIEADDAPAVENFLHKQFDQGRMNRVNLRKEFFKVPLDQIAQACEKMGLKVRLTAMAEAREYRETLEIVKAASVVTGELV